MKCRDCGAPVVVGSCCVRCYWEFHESKLELGIGKLEVEERDELHLGRE